MNTAVWIIQGVLAAFFLMPAFVKLTSSKEALIKKGMVKEGESDMPSRVIGFLELLGSIGIIVPWLTGILPILTPLAATGFGIIMLGAFVVHYRKQDYKAFPLLTTLLVLSAVVAYYRF